jgi:hypothetical protein
VCHFFAQRGEKMTHKKINTMLPQASIVSESPITLRKKSIDKQFLLAYTNSVYLDRIIWLTSGEALPCANG